MLKINKHTLIGYNKSPLIIAEISGNHGGSKKRFINLIENACKNGADLIKIQTYEPKDITLNIKNNYFKIKKGIWKNKYLWDLYKDAHTPYSWHKEAFQTAKKYKKILFSSPFSIRAVYFLEKFNVPLYKIASFEITDLKLINYIASKKKPIIISTGMATIQEIKKAIKEINKFHKKIIILHCVSGYPTDLQETNLKRILILKKIFKDYLIGLSDHTNDIYSSIAANALNPVLIEKHFKISEKSKTTDSAFSITPKKLKELKMILTKLNKNIKKRNSVERNSKKLRRSIYAIKNIEINEKLTEKNIGNFRPKVGICASNYFKVLGRTAKKKIKNGSPIKNSYFL